MANLMIADDSVYQRKSLGKMLNRMGCNIVAEASNGMEAIELYKHHNPDLVIMDMVIPEMEGMEALEKILEIDKSEKVIVVSSLGYEEIVHKALSLGAREFLTKPIEVSHASGVIKSVLEEP